MLAPFSLAKRTLSNIFETPVEALAHERVRLRILFAVAILKLLNFIGGAWDIQWHVEIGRDSLFIPPHLLVIAAFTGGLVLVLFMTAYETGLAAYGQPQPDTLRFGPVRITWPMLAVLCGYAFALLSGVFDELWHQLFGIDATLWSPPHLLIMVATVVVDFSLLFGITASSRRLGYGFTWNSPYLWGIVLIGSFAFESANFQMGEAFIVGYRHQGAGLYGLLFPLTFGAALPLSLMAVIRLSRRFWIGLLILGLTIGLQLLATGIAAAGFAILQPVSVIDEYVLQNPESTAAVSREFARLLGNNGLIGIHQAWTMLLAAPALMLVALLGFVPALRSRPLWAAPIFSASMVLFSYVWFQFTPALQTYPTTWLDILLAVAISTVIGSLMGRWGWRLALRSEGADRAESSFPAASLE